MRHSSLNLLILVVFLFVLNSCKEKNDPVKILIIGKSDSHESLITQTPRALTQVILSRVVSRGQKAALKILNDDHKDKHFQLDQITLGLEFEAEASVSNEFGAAASAGIALHFAKLTDSDDFSVNQNGY